MARVTLTITGLGHEGEGVGRVDGLATFIADALPGETVIAEITERKRNFQRGCLVKVLQAAPERIDAPCTVFEDCGGCQLQHLSYRKGLAWKRQRVEDALQRIGKLSGAKVQPVLGLDQPWRYRNKAVWQAGELDGSIALGYFSHKSNRLVQFEDCLIIPPHFNEIRDYLQRFFRAHRLKAESIKQVTVRYSPVSHETMVGINGHPDVLLKLPWQELTREFPAVKSVLVYDEHSRQVIVAAGKRKIQDRIGQNDFALSFHPFIINSYY